MSKLFKVYANCLYPLLHARKDVHVTCTPDVHSGVHQADSVWSRSLENTLQLKSDALNLHVVCPKRSAYTMGNISEGAFRSRK